MNVLIAINNKKIFNELKNKKEIKIIFNDIQYKEGIIEILEKNKNIDYIIINENLYGQIKIEELIKKIKNINDKIKIAIILIKKDLLKEEYLLKNKIEFIYLDDVCTEKILELIYYKNKIIGISGTAGSGKTITTLIISELINKYKNKKVLLIEDNIKNNTTFKTYRLEKNKENIKKKIIKIKENIYLLNVKNILINNKKEKTKIINEINKIKNNYDYIFIDFQSINSFKIYDKIIEENILILNSNILEINKLKKYILNNKNEIKTILNNYNENSISEKILKNIFKDKIKVIGKIENNKKYNLIINNNFNIKYLDKKSARIFIDIIKKI